MITVEIITRFTVLFLLAPFCNFMMRFFLTHNLCNSSILNPCIMLMTFATSIIHSKYTVVHSIFTCIAEAVINASAYRRAVGPAEIGNNLLLYSLTSFAVRLRIA